jgi:hypothetical protein
MSNDDIAAEAGHTAQTSAITGRPLVGLTMAGDASVSARIWTGAAARAARTPTTSVSSEPGSP